MLVCYLVLKGGLKSCGLAATNIVVTLLTIVYLIHSTFIHHIYLYIYMIDIIKDPSFSTSSHSCESELINKQQI